MKHLLVSREYPPATYPRGGIGTYVEHIARLLAERGETVHVVAELWDGAPLAREVSQQGRLTVHRVPLGYPVDSLTASRDRASAAHVLDAMAGSAFPAQSFSWQAALLIEALVQAEGIDVIEGQDYEAPLYYLLVRRALGLGPAVRPPCFVHLHTAWEFVCHANDWGLASPYDVTIKRLEDCAIRSADAVLCPSGFLAAQAERHYALAAGSVERIPYPIGDTPFVERSATTWERGAICYFGRLEARKGVLEWLGAAIDVASQRPGVRFELIGADTSLTGARGSSMRQTLRSRIPRELAASFTFVDALPRDALRKRLADARLAVVPSRWENFPNTCVEAMCSGLPVLASPHGGMAEMIDDGRTGWLASSGRPADLAATLIRALDTPPSVCAEMGRSASSEIRRRCDNDATLDRQLAFRRQLAARGAGRSLRVPSTPVWRPPVAMSAGLNEGDAARGVDADEHPAANRSPGNAAGLAIVVTDLDDGADLDACLAGIAEQTTAPAIVALVTPHPARIPEDIARRPGWDVVEQPALGADQAREAGLRRVLDRSDAPLGIAVIDTGCRLQPTYVSACLLVLEQHPAVGIVSSWSDEGDAGLAIHPHPALPYQWIASEAVSCLAVRTSALDALQWVRDILGGMPQMGVLTTPILAEGWHAVTYPAVLSRRVRPVPREIAALARSAAARVRLEALVRYRARLAEDAPLLVHLAQAAEAGRDEGAAQRQVGRGALSFATVWRLPLRERLALVARAARNPRYAAQWIARRLP